MFFQPVTLTRSRIRLAYAVEPTPLDTAGGIGFVTRESEGAVA